MFLMEKPIKSDCLDTKNDADIRIAQVQDSFMQEVNTPLGKELSSSSWKSAAQDRESIEAEMREKHEAEIRETVSRMRSQFAEQWPRTVSATIRNNAKVIYRQKVQAYIDGLPIRGIFGLCAMRIKEEKHAQECTENVVIGTADPRTHVKIHVCKYHFTTSLSNVPQDFAFIYSHRWSPNQIVQCSCVLVTGQCDRFLPSKEHVCEKHKIYIVDMIARRMGVFMPKDIRMHLYRFIDTVAIRVWTVKP